MKKLGIAVIGAGILGARHARIWHEQPETELVAVADIQEERARALAERHEAEWTTDYSSLLGDGRIQAVSIATPDFLHCEPVTAALQAGLDVLVEKPLATEIAEARHMVELAASKERILQVNFSQRFLADYRWIKDVIDRGEIGRPVMIQALRNDTIHVPTEMIKWAARTSPLYFMTSHDLDLIRWYLGAEPETAIALESSGVLKSRSIDVHDGFHSLLRFTDGALVNFHGAWIHPNTYPAVADGYLEIIGTEGVISYRRRQREATLHTPKQAQTITFSGPATASEQSGRLVGAMVDSLRLFIECVRERREPMTSGADNLTAVACQVAITTSARSGGAPVPIHV